MVMQLEKATILWWSCPLALRAVVGLDKSPAAEDKIAGSHHAIVPWSVRKACMAPQPHLTCPAQKLQDAGHWAPTRVACVPSQRMHSAMPSHTINM